MNSLSLIFPYYENPMMLQHQVKEWATWGEFKDTVELIVVDDHSRNHPAGRNFEDVWVPNRTFRLTEKLKWNQSGARNFAAASARHEWLFMLAMDHLVPKEMLERLLLFPLQRDTYYNPSRRFTNGVAYHPAKDIYLMHRDDFAIVGGYDEDLAGHYGTDGEYHDRCARKLQRVTIDAEVTIFTPADCLDAATTEWERKTPEDRMAIAEIRRIKTFYNLPPRRGRIKAEQV